MAISNKISRSGLWLLVGGLGLLGVQGAACSAPFRTCHYNRTCPPAEAGSAGDDSGGTGDEPEQSAAGRSGASYGGAGGTLAASGATDIDDVGGASEAGHGGMTGSTGGGTSAGAGGTAGSTFGGADGALGGGTSAAGTAGLSSGGAGGCATACARYQFCASNECLPAYVSTRVLPATDQVNGSGQVNSAVVLTNKPQGDIIVQLSGDLNLHDPGASRLTTLTGHGYASYTADGKLAWFRSRDTLAGSANVGRESQIALVPPSDFAVSYVKYDPPTGPIAGTHHFRVVRVNANSGNLTWEAKDARTTNEAGGALLIVPRPAQGDFLTFYPASGFDPGETCQVTDNGATASMSCLGGNYVSGAVPAADGAVWAWGAPPDTGSYALNPFSTTKWAFTSNPFQYAGNDAFILGIRGASTLVGPWISEGDYGPLLQLAALPGGDLVATAVGSGYMTFNGGQALLGQTGSTLFRLNTTTGQIVWRAPLALKPPLAVVAAPGGRVAVLNQPADEAPNVQLFDGASGALLSTLPLPAVSRPILAAGQTDLFVLGDYSSALDFDPGPGTDKPTSSRGVSISRYSF